MPSDSIAGFLDEAQASQVLFPEQIERLIREPDVPHSNLGSLCDYLLARGVLTPYQARIVREGRGQELSFAGYPIVEELGACPGGTAYKALHPTLRTPLVLRRLRADWLAPADNGANFVARAHAFGMLPHPNTVSLLDAGFYRDELFAVLDWPAGFADLNSLAQEVGGAMPGFLAAEFGRAVASALRMVHERGGFHGDVRPANLLVGPLTVRTAADGSERRRPAPDAVVRLAETGLVPLRPPASQLPPHLAALPYLPPERIDSNTHDTRGDIYGLGATLYYLLTGRAPFAGRDAAELLHRIRSSDPPSLAELRPDLPPEFVALVGQMMDKQSGRRPPSAYAVEQALVKFCRPEKVTTFAAPAPIPVDLSLPGDAYPEAVAVPVATPDVSDGWGVDPGAFAIPTTDDAPIARKPKATDADHKRTRRLLILGGLLHLTAVAILVAWALGAFSSSRTDPNRDSQPTKKGKKA